MQKADKFIAGVVRDVKVIEAISQTLFALELVHLAEVEVEGTDDVLDFSCDIDGLKRALRLMGSGDDE